MSEQDDAGVIRRLREQVEQLAQQVKMRDEVLVEWANDYEKNLTAFIVHEHRRLLGTAGRIPDATIPQKDAIARIHELKSVMNRAINQPHAQVAEIGEKLTRLAQTEVLVRKLQMDKDERLTKAQGEHKKAMQALRDANEQLTTDQQEAEESADEAKRQLKATERTTGVLRAAFLRLEREAKGHDTGLAVAVRRIARDALVSSKAGAEFTRWAIKLIATLQVPIGGFPDQETDEALEEWDTLFAEARSEGRVASDEVRADVQGRDVGGDREPAPGEWRMGVDGLPLDEGGFGPVVGSGEHTDAPRSEAPSGGGDAAPAGEGGQTENGNPGSQTPDRSLNPICCECAYLEKRDRPCNFTGEHVSIDEDESIPF